MEHPARTDCQRGRRGVARLEQLDERLEIRKCVADERDAQYNSSVRIRAGLRGDAGGVGVEALLDEHGRGDLVQSVDLRETEVALDVNVYALATGKHKEHLGNRGQIQTSVGLLHESHEVYFPFGLGWPEASISVEIRLSYNVIAQCAKLECGDCLVDATQGSFFAKYMQRVSQAWTEWRLCARDTD